MELIRGRWSKKYINCPEDKRDYDIMQRGFTMAHELSARAYCEKYDIPALSQEEKLEIASYWEQYGVKISDYSWHAMYYHVTGIHDPKFVPDPLAGLAIYPYYNDHAYEDAWRDKNMFDRLLPDVPFPKTYGKCIRNRLVVAEGDYYERTVQGSKLFCAKLWEAMKGPEEVIVKNSRDSGFGRGVEKFDITSLDDVINMVSACEGRSNFIIQQRVRQHKCLRELNASSTNILRICSWRHGSQVDILYAAARVGVEGAITDVSFVNGEEAVRLVGITKEGFFSEKMLDQDGRLVKVLPSGVRVPAWKKIENIIKKNHLRADNFDIIGWDFTIDESGEPVCLEWNIQWPGTVLYQYTNGPLFGEKTEDILAFMRDRKNQENYIPFYMRLK